MFKGFLLLFNFSGLFFPGSVTVTQTAPASAQRNNSVLVQITINKGTLTGPAKFTEQLPIGFNAVAIDDEGAQTSFDGATIAFAWNSLPSDGILNISFRVDITSAAVIQNDALTGKFFYTANNQNLESDCAPSDINITSGSVMQGGTPAQNSTPSQNASIPPGNIPVQNSTPSAPLNISSSQTDNTNGGSGEIFVVRQFSSLTMAPNGDATVTLTVHKASITGFAKIADSIPAGFIATAAESKGASFTFVDNMANFVWQNLPSDAVFTISYHLSAGSGVSGTYAVGGSFSYLQNDTPLSSTIGRTTFDVSSPENTNTAQSTPPPVTNLPANTTSTAMETATPAATEVSPANNTISNTKPTEQNTSTTPSQTETTPASTPSSTNGITYRVQIIALHNPVSVSSLAGRKIKGHIYTETEGELTKYTVGNYTDYKSASDAKEDIRSKGFEGAFVVSYNAGVRISVPEALKISH